MTNAKILAINLALRPESKVKIFPIGLSYVLSSVQRAGFDFTLVDIDRYRYSDSELDAKLQEKQWDIVLLGCIVTGYRIVKKLLQKIRGIAPGALIVVGNSVAASIPRTLLEKTDADVAVIGEADVTVVDLLDRWTQTGSLTRVEGIWFKDNGAIVKNPVRDVIADIDTIAPPIYDIFDVEAYIVTHRNVIGEPLPMAREKLRAFPVNTARGCINHCTFCYHCFLDVKYRYRSPQNIVSEIEVLSERLGINYALLWDDLTFFSKKQIENFVDRLIERKLEVYWMGAVRGNLFQTDADFNLLLKMKAAGCIWLGYALESANADILKAMKKNVSLPQFKRQKQLLDKSGISSGTSIVLGYPQETPETIAETYQFCLDLGLYPSTGFLLPQPGTPVYQAARDNGKIPDEEEYLLRMGDRQDLRINLTEMGDAEFVQSVTYWLQKLNRDLSLGLDEHTLIKTQYKRTQDA